MTSTVSNNNTKINPLLHNWKCGVRSKMKIATLLFAMHLVAAPMVVIAFIINVYNRFEREDLVLAFIGIGVAATCLAIGIGIFIAIDSFNCLNTKSVVDMKLSLPMTAKGRFLSNFLAGFTAYIVPFLAAQVVSVLGMLYGVIFMDGRTFEAWAGYKDGKVIFEPYVCTYFSVLLPVLLKLILCGILVMLMMYTIAVFIAVCCGNKFESIAYTVLINILIPMTGFYVIAAMFNELFGIDIDQKLVDILTFTSPAGGAIAAWNYCLGDKIYGGADLTTGFGLWALIFFLITAVWFGITFLLYQKRRADQVSKPFAFKFIYHIISSVAVLLIYSAFYLDNHKATLPAVATTLIVYIIMEFAANRGFKRIWLSGIKYVGIIGFSIFLIFAAQKTEGFGAVERVPDISKVESVTLQNYGGFYGIFENGGSYTDADGNLHLGNVLVFTEQENIQTIIDVHHNFVDRRKESRNSSVNDGISIIYTLKNGKKLERKYTYKGIWAEEAEILSKLDLSNEFKTQIAERYKWYILSAEEYYENMSNGFVNSSSISFFNDNFIDNYNPNIQPLASLLKRGFYDQLAEAYCADIMDINEENYYLSDNVNIYSSYYYNRIVIPESFTRTLKVYENFGFEISDRRNFSDTEALKRELQQAANEHNVRIFTASEWREYYSVPDRIKLHGSYDRDYSPRDRALINGNYIYDIDDNFCELYLNMQPMNIVPDDGYIIYVSGITAAVPEEMNDIAKEVASKGQPLGHTDQGAVTVPIQNYYY